MMTTTRVGLPGAVLFGVILSPACTAARQPSIAIDSVVAIHLTTTSALTAPTEEAVWTLDAWTSMWSALGAGQVPAPEAPVIDFARRMALVIGLGPRPSGGFGVAIDSVAVVRDGIAVWYTERAPGSTCMTASVVTNPAVVATIPRRDLPVRFTKRRTTVECDS